MAHQHSTHGSAEEEAIRLWMELPVKVIAPIERAFPEWAAGLQEM